MFLVGIVVLFYTMKFMHSNTAFQKILKKILDKDNEINKTKNLDGMNTSSKVRNKKEKNIKELTTEKEHNDRNVNTFR